MLRQLAWKAYFGIIVVLTALGVGMAVRGIGVDNVAGLGWEVFRSVLTLTGVVGLFGFVWQVPIAKPNLWKGIFVLNLVWIVGGLGYLLATGPEAEKTSIAVSLLAAFVSPYIVASFRYGFRCHDLWGST